MTVFKPIDDLSRSLRQMWAALTGKDVPAPERKPEVIVHDPSAQGPHDLDDPFFDNKIQTRIGDVIASAGQKK